jgi:hypothetical protein
MPPGMPEDLKVRVLEAQKALDAIVLRLEAMEAGVQNTAKDLKQLRHDLNNMRTVILALMTEIDQRHPVPTRKGGTNGKG